MPKTPSFSPQAAAILRVLYWTGGLLVGLTALNFLFVLHHVDSGFKLSDLTPQLKRRPASVQKAAFSKAFLKTPVIEFHCLKDDKEALQVRTQAPTARLRLTDCPESLSVKNETNSSQGDLFALKEGIHTSDFLPLAEGANEIHLKYGEKSVKLRIIRDKPDNHGPSNPERPSS